MQPICKMHTGYEYATSINNELSNFSFSTKYIVNKLENKHTPMTWCTFLVSTYELQQWFELVLCMHKIMNK